MAVVNGTVSDQADSCGISGTNFYTTPYFGWYSGAREWGYTCFTLDAAIPAGATIDSAEVVLWGAVVNSTNHYWYVTDSKDAPQVTAASEKPAIDEGSTTTYPASAEHANCIYTTEWILNTGNGIEIASLLQYLLDKAPAGLASGAKIGLWGSGPSDGGENAYQQYGEDHPPTLTIEYTAGGAAAASRLVNATPLKSLVNGGLLRASLRDVWTYGWTGRHRRAWAPGLALA